MMKLRSIWFKMGGALASLAMLIAIGSQGATCCFMSYQPEVPKELQ